MYPDTNRIRTNRLTVRLDKYEHDVIVALANYQGEHPSALVRQLVMQELADIFGNRDHAIVAKKSA